MAIWMSRAISFQFSRSSNIFSTGHELCAGGSRRGLPEVFSALGTGCNKVPSIRVIVTAPQLPITTTSLSDFSRRGWAIRWLYSCAYFRAAEDSLDEAQAQKLEHVCRKLRLQPGERFLDIGCGWGSLPLYAAWERKVHAEGITLSREQAETAKRRIEDARLERNCKVHLRDYRELVATDKAFDKISSIGMVEHVGLKNLPRYFGIAHRLLRPGGLFLNHGIARSHLSPVRESSFIERYVFPDGRLVTLAQTVSAAESQGFEVRDVENLREHYELTLRCWVEGLTRNADAVLKHVSKMTYRIWLLYMAGSAAAFRRGDIGLYQVLLSKPDRGNSRLPLTREDLYAPQERRLGAEA